MTEVTHSTVTWWQLCLWLINKLNPIMKTSRKTQWSCWYRGFHKEGVIVVQVGDKVYFNEHLGHLPCKEANSPDVVQGASTREDYCCKVCREWQLVFQDQQDHLPRPPELDQSPSLWSCISTVLSMLIDRSRCGHPFTQAPTMLQPGYQLFT